MFIQQQIKSSLRNLKQNIYFYARAEGEASIMQPQQLFLEYCQLLVSGRRTEVCQLDYRVDKITKMINSLGYSTL